jgi:hypothetical protein
MKGATGFFKDGVEYRWVLALARLFTVVRKGGRVGGMSH